MYGCDIYQEQTKSTYNASSISYIKLLCHEHLFTLEGYLKACKKIFKLKYKIPLYITENIQFIPTKSMRHIDVIWINYAQIKHFMSKKEEILIVFKDETEICIEMSKKAWIKQISKLDMIKSYKVKHFHS
jgi:competence transcription factor ComK